MDGAPEPKAEGCSTSYQELIRVLWWAVRQGWVDVLLETSLMLAHLALPMIKDLEQVHDMSGYL